MFNGAEAKLRDARTAMKRLTDLVVQPKISNVQIVSGAPGPKGDIVGTVNPVAFAEAFSSCVAQVRSVGDAVLKDKEAKNLTGFQSWRDSKKAECKKDELLRFINDRRNDDLHEGYGPLVFIMNPFSFNSGAISTAPAPNASGFIDGMGPRWLIDQGTPHERQVPCEKIEGVSYTVAIANPPTTHLGNALTSTDPVTILNLAEQYYAHLLFEAKKRFI